MYRGHTDDGRFRGTYGGAALDDDVTVSVVGDDKHVVEVDRQLVQPRVRVVVLQFGVADREPDAGEPVRDECEHEDEQDEHGRAVLQVVIEFARHATQA